MGPQKAEVALRDALAMGCDQAIFVSDRRFGGSDTWATAYTLSLAIQKLAPYDLVFVENEQQMAKPGRWDLELPLHWTCLW
jgi:electron transfer flavoprotein alpha/beta subunit